MKDYNYNNKTNNDAILTDAYASKLIFLLFNLSFILNVIVIFLVILFSCLFKNNVEINYYIVFFVISILGFFGFLSNYLYKNSPILSFYKYIFYEDKISLKKGLSDKKSVTIKYDDITSITLKKSLFLRKLEFLIYYKHFGELKRYTLSNAIKFAEISDFFRNKMPDKFVVR